jgi:transcriptional regulator with XRE-family HTH domain
MRNKDDLAKKIGSRIKGLRNDSGLTQKLLAVVSGLSPGLISRIENGLTMPSIPTLQIIAESLKTEIGFFFQEREKKDYIILKKGNAAYWDGNVPHKAIGLTSRPTRSLHVHLMPGKWTRAFQPMIFRSGDQKSGEKKVNRQNYRTNRKGGDVTAFKLLTPNPDRPDKLEVNKNLK